MSTRLFPFLASALVCLGSGLLHAEGTPGADAKPAAESAPQSFALTWLQNNPYWNSGKAEFNTYTAKIVRYKAPRECEVIHILVREPFAKDGLVKADNSEAPGTYSVLKLNQILHVPTGLYVYQQMHSSFWRVADGALAKFSLTSNDSCGNTSKLGELATDGSTWRYRFFTYWEGMSEGETAIPTAENTVLYDELPARVRMLDFSKPAGQANIRLVPTMINSKQGNTASAPATLSWAQEAGQIVVTLKHAAGTDEFTLNPSFPFMLKRWKQWDGSDLTLKTALKVDYWNFNGVGDKERALSDPALLQPQ